MRVTALLVCGVLLMSSCSDDGGSDGGSGDGAGASTAASSSVVTVVAPSTSAPGDVPPVVAQYLAALDAGDVATANALRCEKGVVPEDLLDQFAAEVKFVRTSAGGHLTMGSVDLVDPITLGSLYGERPNAQVAYSLATPEGESSLIGVAVITENGSDKLCGVMQAGSPGVQAALSAATITPVAGTVGALESALPDTVVPDSRIVADAPVPDLSKVPGAVDSWSRAWVLDGGGGLRVTLFRTASTDDAVALSKQALEASGLDTAEQITTLANGFQGVSSVASAWTWIQPASVGLRIDKAAGVIGDTAVVIELTGVHAGEGHATIEQVVQSLQLS